MKALVAFTTGGRPETSKIMQDALEFVITRTKSDIDFNVTGICWRDDTLLHPDFNWIIQKDATPGAAFNRALKEYTDFDGKLPDVFFTMNDDVIVSMQTFERLEAILKADETIGLLGAWNDLSERNRGDGVRNIEHSLGTDLVQAGSNFCVGGALHAIPKRTLQFFLGKELRYPYREIQRREDEALSNEIRSLTSMSATIATTVPVSLLPDDGVNHWYRPAILALHYANSRDGFR